MVRGDRSLQRGEHINLAALADLENGAAAIADVKIVVASKAMPVATPMPSTYMDMLPVGVTW